MIQEHTWKLISKLSKRGSDWKYSLIVSLSSSDFFIISLFKIKQYLIDDTLILLSAEDISSSCCKHEDSWDWVRAINASSVSSSSMSVRSPGAFTRKPSLSYCTDMAERFIFPSTAKHSDNSWLSKWNTSRKSWKFFEVKRI